MLSPSSRVVNIKLTPKLCAWLTQVFNESRDVLIHPSLIDFYESDPIYFGWKRRAPQFGSV